MPELYDVAVIGAGPAGASAATASSAAGARTVLLERAVFPRTKTCAGGLLGSSLALLPVESRAQVRGTVDRIVFTHRGKRGGGGGQTGGPALLGMTYRRDLDHALTLHAQRVGAYLQEGVTVRALEEASDLVTLRTSAGARVHARAVVGADGAAGRTARYVGARYAQTDLGLEVEVPPAVRPEWRGQVLIDFGPVPGSYAWIFPKELGDGRVALTAGVIGDRSRSDELRAYLGSFLASHGLLQPARSPAGHLTRCRAPDSPLARGRVLLAGDAAGLLEPWTREGISFALRSGAAAGRFAAQAAQAPTQAATQKAAADYTAWVAAVLTPEMTTGRTLLRAFSGRPGAFYKLITGFGPAQSVFTRFMRGEGGFDQMATGPMRKLLSVS